LSIGVALLVAACGSPDNTYVEERGSGLFLRLPDDWEVFELQSGSPAADRTDPAFGAWRVVIDGAETPSRAHGENPAPSEPVGAVSVTPLRSLQTPLPLNLSSLRTLFPPGQTDPLVEGDVTDIEYEEVDLGHHWGVRLRGTVDLGGGPVRIAQHAFFDEDGQRVHVLRIMCSVDCFDAHRAEIDDVLDSFTLEG
jgi:hypothetical protein